MWKLSQEITDESTRQKLGLELGLSSNKIESIGTNNQKDITMAAYNMLQDWRKLTNNRKVACIKLKEALERTGLTAYVEEILHQ